jgi:hypothetical protein
VIQIVVYSWPFKKKSPHNGNTIIPESIVVNLFEIRASHVSERDSNDFAGPGG